jgi:hypothetical protein
VQSSKNIAPFASSLLLVVSLSASAQTADQDQPACPNVPPLPQMTYDENYRYLANPARRAGFWFQVLIAGLN